MDIDRDLILSTKGFLDEEEGRCLYEIALEASRLGPCLEIGSYCGKSTLYLAAACQQNNGILFSIDHHRGSEEQQPGEAYFDSEFYQNITSHHPSAPVDALHVLIPTAEAVDSTPEQQNIY